MSRRNPKRNHLFLNWLKANRARFFLTPYVLRFRRRRIDIGFHRLTPQLKCRLEFTESGGPWISVDYVSRGKEPMGIIRFYGAEYHTPKGWTSLKLLPGDGRYWTTREEVWAEICFEVFLSWCNAEMATSRWMKVVENGDTSSVHLYEDKSAANPFMIGKGGKSARKRGMTWERLVRIPIEDVEKRNMLLPKETIMKTIDEVLGRNLVEGYSDGSDFWESKVHWTSDAVIVLEIENIFEEYEIEIVEEDLEAVVTVKDFKDMALSKFMEKDLIANDDNR